MGDLKQNFNPDSNPYTTKPGGLLLGLGIVMLFIKWVLPAFYVLKSPLPYVWYTSLIPFGLGLLLIFMNDSYFARLFRMGEKIVSKESENNKKEGDK